MEPVARPTPPERVALVAGVLLVAALTVLPWHSTGPVPTAGGAPGRTAIQAPGAALGIGAALVAAAAVTWRAVAVLLPRAPVRHPGRALLPLALAALALVLVKVVADPDDLGAGAWTSALLAAALVANEVVARRGRRPVSAG